MQLKRGSRPTTASTVSAIWRTSREAPDRCYSVPTSDGTEIRLYASRRPSKETMLLVEQVMRAAYRRLVRVERWLEYDLGGEA